MHELGLCIQINGHVSHMLHSGSFSHYASIPVALKYYKYYLSLDTYTTIFSRVDCSSRKTGHTKANICCILNIT